MSFDPYTLWASLVWGSVGLAYLIYAKKQGKIVPFFGGLLILGASYLMGSVLAMSALCIALIVATHFLARRYD